MNSEMFWTSFKSAILPLCLPIIIIGGVRFGMFTATEAGAVAIIYAMILGLWYHELGPKEIRDGLRETLMTTSSIMLIVAAASTFSWVLTKERIPQMFTEWMISVISNKWVFLVAVDIFLIFVGMFVEGNASMIVLVPLFAPAAAAYGIDSIPLGEYCLLIRRFLREEFFSVCECQENRILIKNIKKPTYLLAICVILKMDYNAQEELWSYSLRKLQQRDSAR